MKWVKWILAVGYVCFILMTTIIGRPVLSTSIFKGLFWEVRNGMWMDILLNVLLFLPLGLIVGGWKGLIFSFILSGAIEVTQYFGKLGFCELDDILNNTIGASIGILCNRGFNYYIDWRNKNEESDDSWC